ncbi:LOW QUALITY PROTEIN: hypothetical protein TorRG33x02_342180, partial [Trema orientale]
FNHPKRVYVAFPFNLFLRPKLWSIEYSYTVTYFNTILNLVSDLFHLICSFYSTFVSQNIIHVSKSHLFFFLSFFFFFLMVRHYLHLSQLK